MIRLLSEKFISLKRFKILERVRFKLFLSHFHWILTFFNADFWRICPLLRGFSLFGTLRKVSASASWGVRFSEVFLLKKSLFLPGLSNCVRYWEVSASWDVRFWEVWLYSINPFPSANDEYSRQEYFIDKKLFLTIYWCIFNL